MAINVNAKKRGWGYDYSDSSLNAYVDGTKVLSLTNSSPSSADNLVEIIGTSTATSGTVRGLWAKLTAAGTSLGQARVISTTLTVTANTDYAYGYYAYTSTVSDKTILQMAGVYVYMEDMGNAVEHQVGISINRNISNVGTSTDCLLEMRNHGSTAATAFVKIVGPATYLWDFDQGDQVAPISAWSSGTTVNLRAAVRVADGTTRYVHLFTT